MVACCITFARACTRLHFFGVRNAWPSVRCALFSTARDAAIDTIKCIPAKCAIIRDIKYANDPRWAELSSDPEYLEMYPLADTWPLHLQKRGAQDSQASSAATVKD